MPSRLRRSAHTPSANGSSWIRVSTRMAIHHRDDFACVYCAAHGGRLTLDHVGPVLRGGAKGSSAALVTACLSCNSAKGAKSYRAWLAALRADGVHTDAVRRRVLRALRTPLNREVGRYLARFRRRA